MTCEWILTGKDKSMEDKDIGKTIRKLVVPLYGFSCGGGGALQLEKQISKLNGVTKVYVNPATEQAYLDVSSEFHMDEVLKLIEKNGFKFGPPQWI